jgi:hypothetical protein
MRKGAVTGLVVVIAGWLVACDSKPTPAGTDAPATDGSAPAAPAVTVKVGDEIVAATSQVAFSQGKVVKIEGDKVTFEYGRVDMKTQVRPQKAVQSVDAYLIGAQVDIKEGDNLVCHVVRRKVQAVPLPTWYPCRVLSVHGNKLRVEDHYATKYELDPERVIKPAAATQKAIGTFIETEIEHRKFDHEFERAGHPYQPVGWEPRADDKVVIHWVGSSWYSGKIVEVKKDKGKVRVDFDGDRWSDRDVAWTEVAPQPIAPRDVVVDQFVILRPSAEDERWEHSKVVAVSGETVEVVNRNGNKTKVARIDLVPIVAPKD